MTSLAIQRQRKIVQDVSATVNFALVPTRTGKNVYVEVNGVRHLLLRGNGGEKSGFMTRLRVPAEKRIPALRYLADGRWAIPKAVA